MESVYSTMLHIQFERFSELVNAGHMIDLLGIFHLYSSQMSSLTGYLLQKKMGKLTWISLVCE